MAEVSLPSSRDLRDLCEAIVGLRIWRRAGEWSQPGIDSNTRDGIVEFHWPDPSDVARDAHMEIAAELERRCFRVVEAPAEAPPESETALDQNEIRSDVPSTRSLRWAPFAEQARS
jgi:hypothetical protein